MSHQYWIKQILKNGLTLFKEFVKATILIVPWMRTCDHRRALWGMPDNIRQIKTFSMRKLVKGFEDNSGVNKDQIQVIVLTQNSIISYKCAKYRTIYY